MNFTSIARLFLGFAACVGLTAHAQVIFSQNFTGGGATSTYVNSTTPTSGQWNAISTSGAGTTVSTASGALVYTRGAANAGSFSRTTDFSPTPTAVSYQFSIAISGNTAATTTAATFQVGSGFGTANGTESNANTYARLGVNLGANGGEFSFRNLSNSTNSATLSGTQSVTWVMNNSGSSITYLAPDSSTYSLANDVADLWAGTTRILTGIAATTTTQNITDLKFVFSAGSGTITLDNISITAIPEPSTYAAIAGALALVGAVIRRRRSA